MSMSLSRIRTYRGVAMTRNRMVYAVRTLNDLTDAARLVAPRYAVPVEYVVGERPDRPKRRGRAEASARALSFYLAHTTRRASVALLSITSGVDRAQIRRAIHRIEDMRDDPDFDRFLSGLEDALHERRA